MQLIGEGLTFDDVLIVPVRSSVSSRKDVDTTTWITKNIRLSIPVGSVPMDTVTESAMAIALARGGGFGIIHRFLSIDDQCNEVLKVKQAAPVITEGVMENIGAVVNSSNETNVSLLTGKGVDFNSASFLSVNNFNGIKPALDSDDHLVCSAAVGLKDTVERAGTLLKAGCNLLCLDIAHAHSDNFIRAVRDIKREFDTDLMIGNIATREAAEDLISAGADCVKVGIGPGSTCTTRLVTGCGVPQLTAISWVSEACREQNIPLIADGGMRSSGDLVKALAAGADCGVFGGLFSGTDEAPSMLVIENGKKYKIARGMASAGAMKRRLEIENKIQTDPASLSSIAPEGAEIIVPYMGSIQGVVNSLAAGLRSGLSYCGARNLKELRKNARFIRVSAATQKESTPHNDFFV